MKSISDEQDLVSKNNNISNVLSQSIMTVSHPNLLQETEEHKSYRVKIDQAQDSNELSRRNNLDASVSNENLDE